MREILFRGKRIQNGEWAFGFLYEHEPPIQCIVPEGYVPEKSTWYILKTAFADWNMPRQVEFIEIDPATVGQFTGLTDKNGKRIFEGDVLSVEGYHGVVKFGLHEACNGWYVEYDKDNGEESGFAELNESWSWKGFGGEIVGNIHDQERREMERHG